jgi:hypothetical protein
MVGLDLPDQLEHQVLKDLLALQDLQDQAEVVVVELLV